MRLKIYKCQVKTKYTNEIVWNMWKIAPNIKLARARAQETLEKIEPINHHNMIIGDVTLKRKGE